MAVVEQRSTHWLLTFMVYLAGTMSNGHHHGLYIYLTVVSDHVGDASHTNEMWAKLGCSIGVSFFTLSVWFFVFIANRSRIVTELLLFCTTCTIAILLLLPYVVAWYWPFVIVSSVLLSANAGLENFMVNRLLPEHITEHRNLLLTWTTIGRPVAGVVYVLISFMIVNEGFTMQKFTLWLVGLRSSMYLCPLIFAVKKKFDKLPEKEKDETQEQEQDELKTITHLHEVNITAAERLHAPLPAVLSRLSQQSVMAEINEAVEDMLSQNTDFEGPFFVPLFITVLDKERYDEIRRKTNRNQFMAVDFAQSTATVMTEYLEMQTAIEASIMDAQAEFMRLCVEHTHSGRPISARQISIMVDFREADAAPPEDLAEPSQTELRDHTLSKESRLDTIHEGEELEDGEESDSHKATVDFTGMKSRSGMRRISQLTSTSRFGPRRVSILTSDINLPLTMGRKRYGLAAQQVDMIVQDPMLCKLRYKLLPWYAKLGQSLRQHLDWFKPQHKFHYYLCIIYCFYGAMGVAYWCTTHVFHLCVESRHLGILYGVLALNVPWAVVIAISSQVISKLKDAGVPIRFLYLIMAIGGTTIHATFLAFSGDTYQYVYLFAYGLFIQPVSVLDVELMLEMCGTQSRTTRHKSIASFVQGMAYLSGSVVCQIEASPIRFKMTSCYFAACGLLLIKSLVSSSRSLKHVLSVLKHRIKRMRMQKLRKELKIQEKLANSEQNDLCVESAIL